MDRLSEAKKLLAAATNETEFRTVASRAYYAVYNHLIEICVGMGFVQNKSADDHRRLSEFLTGQKSALLQRVGKFRLPRIRKIRNHADYNNDVPFTKGLAEEAVTDAEMIIVTWLPKSVVARAAVVSAPATITQPEQVSENKAEPDTK